ncbi:cation-translocating P-type ATPase [Saccharopolyspora rosea]|uniref:Cation-translocating P-type ATPase n=1 Tax=Saccharopolyspora rosea TaxID=524884 RepID=A0ABW3FS80_9PSEU
MLGRLLSQAAEVAGPVLQAARGLARPWRGSGRTHLRVRGVHRPGTEAAARDLEQRLLALEGVRSVETNAALGRVVVEHDPTTLGTAALAGVIAKIEGEYGLDDAEHSPAGRMHPANAEILVRDVGALGASLLSVGYAALGSLVPVRIPLVPAVASLSDSVPWLRSGLEKTLGRATTDAVLSLGGALSQGLAEGPLAAVTDACGRFCISREAIARHQAWLQWAGTAPAGAHTSSPIDARPRPVPLPGGPVERVANTSGGLAFGGYAALLAATRSPRRALAALQAATPRPAKAGREAFAAQLDTALSARGVLVLQPDALRRLDRVDTVVVDPRALLTGRRVIDEVIPLDDGDTSQLYARASEVVDLQDPGRERARGQWSARPPPEVALSAEARATAAERADRGGDVVVLCHRSRPVALAVVVDEIDPLAEALVTAAGGVGSVVLGGRAGQLDRRLGVERVVPGGDRLARSVRALQRDGAVVAVVASRAHAALTAADVGIGVSERSSWGADVHCPSPVTAHLLLAAVEQARTASRYAASLSVAGSCLGALLAVLGPARGAPGRTSFPVHTATLFALGTGTWLGMRAAKRAPPVPAERAPWHAMPTSSVLSLLDSDERGLSASQAGRRRAPEEQRTRTGLVAATVENLAGPMTPVLGAGAAVSAVLGSATDALLIGGVLVFSALIDGAQRVRADRELAALLEAGQLRVRLRRRGRTTSVPADDLVEGDIIELRAGDGVPADCRVLSAEALEVDESSLTGESEPVTKTAEATVAAAVADRTCMLYRGTAVASGSATAVVVAVGANTEIGRTAREFGGGAAATGGVEARLSQLTGQVLPLALGAGAMLLVVDLLRAAPIGQSVARSVGLAVAAVPEGLPFVARIAELAAARRLSQRGVLVRTPSTVEALGRVDMLCFDKTGTLTQGRISLRRVSDGRTDQSTSDLDPQHREVLAAAVRASPRPSGDRPPPHLTDRAVLDGAEAVEVRADRPADDELPFEPSRGFHAVRSGNLLSVKGAPEVVLQRCRRWRLPDGVLAFDADARARVDAEIERLALRGYRLLAVAEREVTGRGELDESDVDDLDLVGLLCLADPVHPAAAESVARLRRSGVDVVMITGDHPSTAEAIATELEMVDGSRVMTGTELDALDDEQLTGELPKISVFARVSPAQKARIVRCLRAAGRVVAMTGDGANDVPAIGLAHVGIAFGSRATSAAREAADLLVSNDRIETLTEGIVEGRGMWASVRDALSILLGGNLGEIGYSLGAGLLSSGAALNPRQLLVVNMLTDVLPASAIAVSPPPGRSPEQLLAEGPDVSLGQALARDVYVRATATAGAAGLAWLLSRPTATAGQARTAGLVALVSAQLAQTVAMRGRTPLVLVATAGSVLLLGVLVQTPGVSTFFGSSPLWPHHWGIALGCAAAAALGVLGWQWWTGRA